MLASRTIAPNFLGFRIDECPIVGRAHQPRHDALDLELFRDRLVAQARDDHRIEARYDRLRRAGRGEQPEPVEQLVILQLRPGHGQRRHVGKLRHALARGHRDGADAPVLHQRQRGGKTRKAHRDRAGRHIGDGGRRAAIGHMQHVGAGHVVHQFAGELLRIADARRRERQLAAVRPHIGDQLGGVAHRRLRRDHDHAGHDPGERDARLSRGCGPS